MTHATSQRAATDCDACGGSGDQADVPYDAWLAGQGIDPDTGESW